MSEPAEDVRVARGTIAVQGSQVVGVLATLTVITLLGRTLTLSQFGLYGLLLSIAGYLAIVQLSVEGATIRKLAGAADEAARDRIVSLALAIYTAGGLLSGVVIAGGGLLLVAVLPIPAELHTEAREGVLALGAMTALGWPFKVFQDVLRGAQRFAAAAAAEVIAFLAFVGLTILLVVVDAPLWSLVAVGGAVSVLIGAASLIVLALTRSIPRPHRAGLTREGARDLLGFSAQLSSIGLSDLFLYSADRLVLASFTSTRVVGLYEGAARPHNLVRQAQATMVVAVLPVATSYLEAGDRFRVRELLLRGTRYVMAVVVPLTVVLVVLAGPILEVWLGERYREAGTAMAILTSYWVLNAATGVGGSMLVADGDVRWFSRYAWSVALVNLVLSLGLTAWLGLEGVVLGTSIPYVLLFPVFLRRMAGRFDVPVGEIVRFAMLPAWTIGAGIAALLVLVRIFAEPQTLPAVAAVAAGALALAYGAYALIFFGDDERRLVRGLVGAS